MRASLLVLVPAVAMFLYLLVALLTDDSSSGALGYVLGSAPFLLVAAAVVLLGVASAGVVVGRAIAARGTRGG
ncbi:MAG: hypothetical protein KC442_23535 [Thermomicrobiales bacterium]|nr:hypothetical protein [Thermomicrobiales bacterium]